MAPGQRSEKQQNLIQGPIDGGTKTSLLYTEAVGMPPEQRSEKQQNLIQGPIDGGINTSLLYT